MKAKSGSSSFTAGETSSVKEEAYRNAKALALKQAEEETCGLWAAVDGKYGNLIIPLIRPGALKISEDFNEISIQEERRS